jgi:hypothetical protein
MTNSWLEAPIFRAMFVPLLGSPIFFEPIADVSAEGESGTKAQKPEGNAPDRDHSVA